MTLCSCDTVTGSSSSCSFTISNTSTGKALEVSHSATSGDCSSFTSATSGSCIVGNNTHSTGGIGVKGLTAAGKAIYGVASSTGNGVYGSSISGAGVVGASYYNHGISASSTDGHGINAITTNGIGINGASTNGNGVYASSVNNTALVGISSGSGCYGVWGKNTSTSGNGNGVYGEACAANAAGVYGKSNVTSGFGGKFYATGTSGTGIESYGTNIGVNTSGVIGLYSSGTNIAVHGVTTGGYGGKFESTSSSGGYFSGTYGIESTGVNRGVSGISSATNGFGGHFTSLGSNSIGVYGTGESIGVKGITANTSSTAGYFDSAWDGVYAEGDYRGLYARCTASGGEAAIVALGSNGPWGIKVLGNSYLGGDTNVYGNLDCTGWVNKSGGSFTIDHPLDPENKNLNHAFVESPDMKNIYDGIVVCDDNGYAVIELPGYFDSLNERFRYGLTAIGGEAPKMHVSKKIENNKFEIFSGVAGMEVSWQVTGIRKDLYALANPMIVEAEKKEKGVYRNPELYGKQREKK